MNDSNRQPSICPQKPDAQFLRLYRMGLTDIDGCPEVMGLEMLASVTSGCLYDDLDKLSALSLYNEAIANPFPCQLSQIHTRLLKAYEEAGEPVPKPIQLLAKDADCLTYFLVAFFEDWREYLSADGLLEVQNT
ncbi:hypothetical protein CE91St46_10890 [Eubacteriales bacterium]|uniref:hypothetical protein n=1 Tax=Anaerotruncus TaxID=244127 RepID=UPI000E4F32EA|nr:hypothetical protein [Anaerotruncus sp. AF02-27]MCM0707198.1 hypothetical protein [Faecalicatena sp. BF-R-105]GKH48140.1 hypothetical protein CE91St45_27020 [Oscillospiraceae bacterium]GKH49978.1 hypothetical protein CE91St46_10890 [Eubacteriales bacterium]RGX53443.1 hypothetical protein DWV16_16735 [Anaerotruncus sp. AF02-27]GKH62614.1 hypothetical protein CE91St47_10830 [Eubacteriales bacterium]